MNDQSLPPKVQAVYEKADEEGRPRAAKRVLIEAIEAVKAQRKLTAALEKAGLSADNDQNGWPTSEAEIPDTNSALPSFAVPVGGVTGVVGLYRGITEAIGTPDPTDFKELLISGVVPTVVGAYTAAKGIQWDNRSAAQNQARGAFRTWGKAQQKAVDTYADLFGVNQTDAAHGLAELQGAIVADFPNVAKAIKVEPSLDAPVSRGL